MANRKILEFDTRTKELVHEYNEHGGSVLSLAAVDLSGNRFISTGEDRRVLVWEHLMPSSAGKATEPDLPVISRTFMHPNRKYLLG